MKIAFILLAAAASILWNTGCASDDHTRTTTTTSTEVGTTREYK
jgi:hypothetical protein